MALTVWLTAPGEELRDLLRQLRLVIVQLDEPREPAAGADAIQPLACAGRGASLGMSTSTSR